MTEPAGKRLAEPALMAWIDIKKCRSAGPAIEIFVAAANGEIGLGASQVNRHRTCRMREIPDDEDTLVMRRPGQRRHVVTIAVAVVDMGQHQHSHIFIQHVRDIFWGIGKNQPVTLADLLGHAFRDIKISRKIIALRNDLAAFAD